MAHHRTRGFLLTCAVFTSWLVAGCGTDETLDGDFPSRVLDAGDDTSDETEPTGRPQTPTPPPPPPASEQSPFGTQCLRDSQCGDGFTCLTDDDERFLGGGAANGYCSKVCESDTECSELDSGSFCLATTGNATSGLCVQGCEAGAGLGSKCHDRPDVACDGVSIPFGGFCRPMCRGDADCGDGLRCDLGLGSCVDDERDGEPIGAECDPEAEPEESGCESGLCLSFSDTFAACSGFCNVSVYGCGPDSATADEPGAPACLFAADPNNAGPGDLGFCNQRCACDGDCLHPDARCLLVGEQEAAVLGAPGFCVSPDWEPAAGETLGATCPERDGGVSDAGTDASAAPVDAAGDAASDAVSDGGDLDAASALDAARDE